MLTYIATTVFLIFIASILILQRLQAILDPKRPKPSQYGSSKSAHLLIVLGSGGHTAEMLAMLERALTDPDETRRLSWTKFSHRTWVVSSGDALSARRAMEFEDMAARLSGAAGSAKEGDAKPAFSVITIPRARLIHQPLLTTPISSLRTLFAALRLLIPQTNTATPSDAVDFPDIILSNGPATAAITILAALLLRLFNIRGCHSRGKLRTVYVESWARVWRLSLTGRLVERVVDRFMVQWPQLVGVGGRREYGGWLV